MFAVAVCAGNKRVVLRVRFEKTGLVNGQRQLGIRVMGRRGSTSRILLVTEGGLSRYGDKRLAIRRRFLNPSQPLQSFHHSWNKL